MATITNETNYIQIEDGVSKIAIPKAQIVEIRKKASAIIIHRGENKAPITINPDEITSPAFVDLDDLYETIASYI